MTQKQVLLSLIDSEGCILTNEVIAKTYTVKQLKEMYFTLTESTLASKGKDKMVDTLRRLVVTCTGGLFREDRIGFTNKEY